MVDRKKSPCPHLLFPKKLLMAQDMLWNYWNFHIHSEKCPNPAREENLWIGTSASFTKWVLHVSWLRPVNSQPGVQVADDLWCSLSLSSRAWKDRPASPRRWEIMPVLLSSLNAPVCVSWFVFEGTGADLNETKKSPALPSTTNFFFF